MEEDFAVFESPFTSELETLPFLESHFTAESPFTSELETLPFLESPFTAELETLVAKDIYNNGVYYARITV